MFNLLWANLSSPGMPSDPRQLNYLEPTSFAANTAFPKPGESNTIETWAESMNASGLTPNSHCTIIDCGGTNSKFG